MVRLPSPQRIVLALFLAVVLAAPAAMEAQSFPRAKAREAGFVAALASELHAQWWSFLSGLWEKNGCVIDPYGGCAKASTDKADERCGIDPHDSCKPGSGDLSGRTRRGG